MQLTHPKSFAKGLREVKVKDYKEVVRKLMKAIGINNRNSFAKWRDGRVAVLDYEIEAKIKAVFAEYGVKKPWGE